jgi:prefoldin subunit 5
MASVPPSGGAGDAPAAGPSGRAIKLMVENYYNINPNDLDDEDEENDDKHVDQHNEQSLRSPAPPLSPLSLPGSLANTARDLISGVATGVIGIVAGPMGGPGGADPVSISALSRRKSTDLDSEMFESKAFLDAVLKERSLKQLIDVDDELQSSIRALDTDMQSLVYDNYNKFISATDTIREMKGKVENMDSDMSVLVESMNKLNKSSKELRDVLRPNRQRIAKLTQLKNLLEQKEKEKEKQIKEKEKPSSSSLQSPPISSTRIKASQ